jgi:hypothetical protein
MDASLKKILRGISLEIRRLSWKAFMTRRPASGIPATLSAA